MNLFNETPKMYGEQNQLGQPEAFAKMMAHREQMAMNAYSPDHKAIAGAEQIKGQDLGTVTIQLRQLEKNVAMMSEAIEMLRGKLSPVLEAVPERDKNPAQKPPATSEMAGFISRLNDVLTDQIYRVRSLTEGVDL